MTPADSAIAEPNLATQLDEFFLADDIVPCRREQIACHELDGEAVLYDVAHHAMHYLNTTALFILNLCDGRRSVAGMATILALHYDLDLDDAHVRAQVLADIRQTLTQLANGGLIELGREPRP
jgi:hypothetical protein